MCTCVRASVHACTCVCMHACNWHAWMHIDACIVVCICHHPCMLHACIRVHLCMYLRVLTHMHACTHMPRNYPCMRAYTTAHRSLPQRRFRRHAVHYVCAHICARAHTCMCACVSMVCPRLLPCIITTIITNAIVIYCPLTSHWGAFSLPLSPLPLPLSTSLKSIPAKGAQI